MGEAARRGPARRPSERARLRVRECLAGQAAEAGATRGGGRFPVPGGALLRRRVRRRARRGDLPRAGARPGPGSRPGVREDRAAAPEGGPRAQAGRRLRGGGAAPSARGAGTAAEARGGAALRGGRRGREGHRSAPAPLAPRTGRRGVARSPRGALREGQPTARRRPPERAGARRGAAARRVDEEEAAHAYHRALRGPPARARARDAAHRAAAGDRPRQRGGAPSRPEAPRHQGPRWTGRVGAGTGGGFVRHAAGDRAVPDDRAGEHSRAEAREPADEAGEAEERADGRRQGGHGGLRAGPRHRRERRRSTCALRGAGDQAVALRRRRQGAAARPGHRERPRGEGQG